MSRKHWSDLFILAAAVCLVLTMVLGDYRRLLPLVAVPLFVVAATRARRRMV